MIKRTARAPEKLSRNWSGSAYWSASLLSGSGSLGWPGRWHYSITWGARNWNLPIPRIAWR